MMAAPQNPPFLGRVCFPPAENCSDRGAFRARRVEQLGARAYPSSASGEHAVVCKCRAKFIKIWGFENEAFPGPGHGTHHPRFSAVLREASHHQVLEGRTWKLPGAKRVVLSSTHLLSGDGDYAFNRGSPPSPTFTKWPPHPSPRAHNLPNGPWHRCAPQPRAPD